MTNTTWTSKPNHATDAEFRTWGSAINTALTAVGMVNTADTGQINWTTVTRASVNTDAGYEIWKFNDALQSTVPVFFKLYYGTGSNAAYPRIRLEIGTASNGSGTLSGTGSGTVTTVAGVGTGDTTVRDNWAASDGSGLVLCLWNTSSTGSAKTLIVIDRFRDSSGTASSAGWMLEYRNENSAASNLTTIINAVDGVASSLSYTPCLVPFPIAANTSFLDASSNVVFFPHYVACKQGVYGTKMVLSYAVADLGYDSQISCSHMGSTRTFRSLGANANYMNIDNVGTGSVYVTCAVWWSD